MYHHIWCPPPVSVQRTLSIHVCPAMFCRWMVAIVSLLAQKSWYMSLRRRAGLGKVAPALAVSGGHTWLSPQKLIFPNPPHPGRLQNPSLKTAQHCICSNSCVFFVRFVDFKHTNMCEYGFLTARVLQCFIVRHTHTQNDWQWNLVYS